MTKKSQTARNQFTDSQSSNQIDSKTLVNSVTEALLEKKGKDIVVLDVRKLTTLTDYFVVSHGTSETQMRALAGSVSEKTKKDLGEAVWKQEGLEAKNWIILDYVNVVVHIFNEEKREFYGIERMWSDAEISEIADSKTPV